MKEGTFNDWHFNVNAEVKLFQTIAFDDLYDIFSHHVVSQQRNWRFPSVSGSL